MKGRSNTEPKLLRAMRRPPGYFYAAQLAELAGVTMESASCAIGRLIFRGDIVFVGFAREAGLEIRGNTKLYGLKGTPRLSEKATTVAAVTDEIRVAQRIAIGRGSVWGAGLA